VTMYFASSTSIVDFEGLDKKAERVRALMIRATQAQITELWRQLDLSAIYHDWALEGQVVLPDELDSAFDSRAVTDVTNLPLCLSLRSHRRALDYAREVASRKKFSFSLDLFKDLNSLFASDQDSAKNGRYRKDIPLHRFYFHEIAHPGNISSNMRKLVAWLNEPEDALALHPIEWTAKFHERFMKIFPFAETSGKIGRTVANLILIRQGYLPAIIHATERQRYYETIRQSNNELVVLLFESAMSSLDAAEKYLRRARMAS
jgi:hypothetical protein